jgi:hypothetical protein
MLGRMFTVKITLHDRKTLLTRNVEALSDIDAVEDTLDLYRIDIADVAHLLVKQS